MRFCVTTGPPGGAITDIARPDPTLTGTAWAGRIEQWADAVVADCIELDPTDVSTPRRASVGRSLRHEPISTHITTEAILAEEERIASWALAAQADEPQPSSTDEAGMVGTHSLANLTRLADADGCGYARR